MIRQSMGCIDSECRGCGFDGKFSLLEWKDKIYLYARANIAYDHLHGRSYRHVQVTTTCGKDLNSWSKFRLIDLPSLPSAEDFVKRDLDHQVAISVYYLSVTKWTSTHILGAFPGCIPDRRDPVMKRTCGVFLTSSLDGFKWSPPKILESQSTILGDGVHVPLSPVGFLNRRVVLMRRTCDEADRFFLSRELPEDFGTRSNTTNLAALGSLSPLWIQTTKLI